MIGGVEADGDYGPKTEARVRAYQKMRGIDVDGVVGVTTWREINKM
ncbi:peptidoglycan-binding domain-containing protein [Actinoplanes sp. NPDC049548]